MHHWPHICSEQPAWRLQRAPLTIEAVLGKAICGTGSAPPCIGVSLEATVSEAWPQALPLRPPFSCCWRDRMTSTVPWSNTGRSWSSGAAGSETSGWLHALLHSLLLDLVVSLLLLLLLPLAGSSSAAASAAATLADSGGSLRMASATAAARGCGALSAVAGRNFLLAAAGAPPWQGTSPRRPPHGPAQLGPWGPEQVLYSSPWDTEWSLVRKGLTCCRGMEGAAVMTSKARRRPKQGICFSTTRSPRSVWLPAKAGAAGGWLINKGRRRAEHANAAAALSDGTFKCSRAACLDGKDFMSPQSSVQAELC
jgi:hypothetical protein